MSYRTGTVVNTPASQATDFYQTYVKPLLTAHAAWQFVEDYNGDATYNVHVWKLLASASGAPNDVYFGFFDQKTGNTQFYMRGFETYNAATHQLTHGTKNPGGNGMTTNANGAFDDTAYTISITGDTYAGYKNVNTATAGGTYDYWIVVTNFGIYVTTRVGASVYGMFGAVYDSLLPTPLAVNDPYPFYLGDFNGGSAWGQTTRMPMIGAKPAVGYMYNLTNNDWTGVAASQSNTALPDFYQSAPTASRVVLCTTTAQQYGRPDLYGWLRGLAKPELLRVALGSGANTGDTVQIGGQTYVLMSASGFWVNTQAA